MSWWKRLIEKWKEFIEDTAKGNDLRWKGETPSCCAKDKNKELPEER